MEQNVFYICIGDSCDAASRIANGIDIIQEHTTKNHSIISSATFLELIEKGKIIEHQQRCVELQLTISQISHNLQMKFCELLETQITKISTYFGDSSRSLQVIEDLRQKNYLECQTKEITISRLIKMLKTDQEKQMQHYEKIVERFISEMNSVQELMQSLISGKERKDKSMNPSKNISRVNSAKANQKKTTFAKKFNWNKTITIEDIIQQLQEEMKTSIITRIDLDISYTKIQSLESFCDKLLELEELTILNLDIQYDFFYYYLRGTQVKSLKSLADTVLKLKNLKTVNFKSRVYGGLPREEHEYLAQQIALIKNLDFKISFGHYDQYTEKAKKEFLKEFKLE